MKKLIFISLFVMYPLITFAVEQEVDRFKLIGYDNENKKKWELEGRQAKVNGNFVNVVPIEAKIYSKDTIVDVKAEMGTLDKVKNSMLLEKNVVAKTSDNLILYTDVLNWSGKENRVWTDENLKLVRNETIITGKGGEAETELKKVKIKKDVKVISPPQTTITCDGPLDVDYEKNIAIFNNNVHIIDKKGELFCDKLYVYFDPNKKKIVKAHAIGNVKIKRGNSLSFSKEAVYDVENSKVTLLGRPKLIIYPEKK
jgi:LPS export ABC transporter protein LptC